MTAALRTEGLTRTWGAFAANSDVSLEIAQGARHALIGPNGAGKTTFINLLTGVLQPTRGEVFLGDRRITRTSQHERVKMGMTRTFQITTIFPGLTVLESVMLAVCERTGSAWHWFRDSEDAGGVRRHGGGEFSGRRPAWPRSRRKADRRRRECNHGARQRW